MGRNDHFDFGKAEQDMRGHEGKAIAEHLFEGVENIFGPMKMASQHRAMSQLEGQFPGHQIHVDDNEEPYHSASHGPWEGRYHGGPYIEVHHKPTQEAVEVIHVGENKTFGHEHMESALKEFHETSGADYIKANNLDRKRKPKDVDLR